MFARLGPWCYAHRRLVVVLWVVLLFGANGVAGAVGENYRADFSPPGAESTAGFETLRAEFGGEGTGYTGTIVFRAEQGVDDPEVAAQMEALFADVAQMEGVVRVQSPYEPGGEQQIAAQGPNAGTIAYANVELPDDVDTVVANEISHAIRDQAPVIDGLEVERGGFIFADFEQPNSEVLGIAFAIIILIVAFGSVLAMGLPIGVALFGIGVGSALLTLFSHIMEVPEFAPFIGIMIGLGVGIDYALLIVTRHREQMHAGHTVGEAVGIAVDTAGRAVVFAGVTVVISLLGMILMGVGFVAGLAVTAAATVLVTVVAAVTLLPAFLGFAGENLERTRWRGLIAAGFVAIALVGVGVKITPLLVGLPVAVVVLIAGFFVPPLKKEVAHRPPKPRQETLAYRWSRIIQRRPWPFTIGAAALLAVLAMPVLSLHLGFSDESNSAEDTTTKQAYDLLVDGFGEGFTGPLFLVARTPDGAATGSETGVAALGAVTDAVQADPAVVAAVGPQPNDGGTAVRWFVVPATGPQDAATSDLVNRLRHDVLPPVEDATGVDVQVTGLVAAQIDFADVLAQRMPYFFGAVLALSFLFLMVVFRSLLVPLKAVIMNLLSIGAAYGIVVALFQWGWLGDVTGVSPGPIEAWAPMMLFAVVFGLSMDYEVFLLSRIREEWLRTGDSRTSVADGLAATAKVITAAAAIMIVVFGCFLLENERVLKLMGIGLAVAIFLDATVVRLLLVPATMELLGDRNWWLPRWLDRLLPTVAVEGHVEHLDDDGGDGSRDEGGEREPVLIEP